MKKYLFLLLLGLQLTGVAQTDFSLQQMELKDSTIVKVGLWAEEQYNSNVINNAVFTSGLFKNSIPYDALDNMNGRIVKNNRAGSNTFGRLYFSHLLQRENDSNASSVFISLRQHTQFTAQFSGDAIKLIAYGNKQFAGKTAFFKPLDLALQQYLTLQVGWIRKKDNRTLGIAPGLVIGNKYGSITTENGFLYTSPIGDSLYGEAKGEWFQTDTASKLFYDPNGTGASIDIFYSIPVNWFKKNDQGKGSLTFELNDLGFIQWNANTLYYRIDGNYNWTGFRADNLFDINDSIITAQRPDDVQNRLIVKQEKKSITTPLPARLAVYYKEQFNSTVELSAMLEYRFFSHMLPYLALNQSVRVNASKKSLGIYWNFYESFGGYNYIGLGTGLRLEHQKFNALIGTRNLIGVLGPKYLSGLNVHLGLNWKITE